MTGINDLCKYGGSGDTCGPLMTYDVCICALEAERDGLRTALIDARDNGLIYWEPNTSRGHVSKAEMIQRIDAALSANGPSPETVPAMPVRSGDGGSDELPDHVLFICNAYEAGFGHAWRDLCNPYGAGSDEWHAYAYGKDEGERRTDVTLTV